MWRGAGGSYLMHSNTDYMIGWNRYLPRIKYIGLNTYRLAFKFPWDISGATADVLDVAKLDEIIAFLGANGVQSIVDNHGDYIVQGSEYSNMLDPNFVSSWQQLAIHYKDNPYVAAFEIDNEPPHSTVAAKQVNAQYYHDTTLAIRAIDPNRLCIWETPNYIPSFDTIQNLMLSNVVYTRHWSTTGQLANIVKYGVEAYSHMIIDPLISTRSQYNIPIWFGELSGPLGGNVTVYDPTDPLWQTTKQLLLRCEENSLPWNLWNGVQTIDNDRLGVYQNMFPLYPSIPLFSVMAAVFLIYKSYKGQGHIAFC
jgi:hypothetical protein